MSEQIQSINGEQPVLKRTEQEIEREEYLIRKACVQVLQAPKTCSKDRLRAAKLLKDMLVRAELASKRIRKISATKKGNQDKNSQIDGILRQVNAA